MLVTTKRKNSPGFKGHRFPPEIIEYAVWLAFLRQAMDNARLYQPVAMISARAHNYRKVLAEINRHCDAGHSIRHIDQKYLNNRIEGDHSVLKQRLNSMRGLK